MLAGEHTTRFTLRKIELEAVGGWSQWGEGTGRLTSEEATIRKPEMTLEPAPGPAWGVGREADARDTSAIELT